MHVVRIFTGPDNESHFEDLDIPLKSYSHGALSDLVPGSGVIFRETPVGGEIDFHVAPRRQFVVTLSGSVDIICGDGATRRLGAGDILLADDTTGHGHISREVEGPRRSIFLPVPESFDLSPWRKA